MSAQRQQVRFRGEWRVPGFEAALKAEQGVTHVIVDGARWERRRRTNQFSYCGTCAATLGEIHGAGCVAEECPACGGALAACGCDAEFTTGEAVPTTTDAMRANMAEERGRVLLDRIRTILARAGSRGRCRACGADVWWVAGATMDVAGDQHNCAGDD